MLLSFYERKGKGKGKGKVKGEGEGEREGEGENKLPDSSDLKHRYLFPTKIKILNILG